MSETNERPGFPFDRRQRWRLMLGREGEDTLRGAPRGGAGESAGADLGPASGGEAVLTPEQQEIDEALGTVYDEGDGAGDGAGGFGAGPGGGRVGGKRSAGLGAGGGRVARWLGDVRKYFERDVVVMLQQDALDKHPTLKTLLFEPELLSQVTPSIEMVGTLLSLKGMVPETAKEAAREIVRAVVEELTKKLRSELERAVRGALDRSRHQPLPSLPNLDWKRTVRRNLQNYVPERRLLVPERFYFWSRQQRRREWNVIVCMDQSGSMAESVVYSGVMAAIFATLPALETHVVAFDTEVVDLTPQLSDPVDLLFGVQLGGGTDIRRAVEYCRGLIHDPKRTLFLLISDLIEGGNQDRLVQHVTEMTASGVRAVALLALSDQGKPEFDEALAARFVRAGCPAFACTPKALPELIDAMLRNRDLQRFSEEHHGKSKS